MTINLSLLRLVLVTIFWLLLWLAAVVWEKALGWPVLTLLGLTLVATANSHPGQKMIQVGLASLIVAGLYHLPVTVIVILLVVTSRIGANSHSWWRISLLMAWLGSFALGYGQKVALDGTALIYLSCLVLISGLSMIYFRRWQPKMT